MNPASSSFHLGHRPALDGVRGFAILMVLVDHGRIVGDGFGFMGVNTFFVLSGFLITCLLVEEHDRTGKITFKNFYFRRGLRLLPALIVMLAAFVLFCFMVDPYKRAVRELYEALAALFYISNWTAMYHIGRHLSLLHTWSLSVEEQFYFIWPGILLWLLSKCTRSSILCWIFLGAVLSVMLRVALFVGGTTELSGNVFPLDPARLTGGTDTRADSLLIGCFAGVLACSNLLPRGAGFQQILKLAATSAVPLLVGLAICPKMDPLMVYCGWFAASILAMALILYLVSAPESWLHRCLQNRPLAYLGTISYSLYLWHFPISTALVQHHLPWTNMTYLIPVIPVALLSYYLIEKPCLRLKKRFQVVD